MLLTAIKSLLPFLIVGIVITRETDHMNVSKRFWLRSASINRVDRDSHGLIYPEACNLNEIRSREEKLGRPRPMG